MTATRTKRTRFIGRTWDSWVVFLAGGQISLWALGWWHAPLWKQFLVYLAWAALTPSDLREWIERG
jgi:hypothetical protein